MSKKYLGMGLVLCLLLTGCVKQTVPDKDEPVQTLNASKEDQKNQEFQESKENQESALPPAAQQENESQQEMPDEPAGNEPVSAEPETPAEPEISIPEDAAVPEAEDEPEPAEPDPVEPEEPEEEEIVFAHPRNVESDIVFSEDKINIYVFWGNGCGHCEELFAYLDSLDADIQELFQIYSLEVWYDDANKQLMTNLAEFLGSDASGVPYMIIGEEDFLGYDASINQDILKAIQSASLSNDMVLKFKEH